MNKQNEECSYCCLTIVALSIAFCSAVITFLVANYMYTGLPCLDYPLSVDLEYEELLWNGSDRLIVSGKEVMIIRLDKDRRCYVLPSCFAEDKARQRFTIIPEPLTQAIGTHIAGKEGWTFCDGLPMYLLEKPKGS